VNSKDREQRTLLRAPERDAPTAVEDLKRAEQPEFHVASFRA
jgi:hypothetical protein